MWLEIRIPRKFPGADSCAVDYKIEIGIDFFEFFEANLPIDCAARSQQTRSEIIAIDRGVRERDAQRATAFEDRPQAGGYSSSAKWNRPIWDLNFVRARKLAQVDHGNAV